MKKDEIKQCIRDLALSQGCWGRLLREVAEWPQEEQDNYWQSLEDMNFKDSLDLILHLEGNA